MLAALWNFLFGCNHKRTTFPQSRRSNGNARGRAFNHFDTYVACLDCGKEFAYSWDEMKIVGPPRAAGNTVPERVESFVTTK